MILIHIQPRSVIVFSFQILYIFSLQPLTVLKKEGWYYCCSLDLPGIVGIAMPSIWNNTFSFAEDFSCFFLAV